MSTRQGLLRALVKAGREKKPTPPAPRRWNILRGDTVQVTAYRHADRGKQGVVLAVLRKPSPPRVVVEGVNMKEMSIRADPERGIKAGTRQAEAPLPYSDVQLVDPVTGLPTRIFRKYLEDGTKVRVSKRSGAVIPRPPILTQRRNPKARLPTESDTAEDDVVWQVTYQK